MSVDMIPADDRVCHGTISEHTVPIFVVMAWKMGAPSTTITPANVEHQKEELSEKIMHHSYPVLDIYRVSRYINLPTRNRILFNHAFRKHCDNLTCQLAPAPTIPRFAK